jgi:CheY-like chemotaxis protein
VDDHVLIRDALRGVLRELTDDATVLEAADCLQAMRLIEAHPDLHLILLDLNLPDYDGFTMLADPTCPANFPEPEAYALSRGHGYLPGSRCFCSEGLSGRTMRTRQ